MRLCVLVKLYARFALKHLQGLTAAYFFHAAHATALFQRRALTTHLIININAKMC